MSIVFAAASLEALLNEAEESTAQIQSKFQLAHLVLTGRTYDKGTAPYQDFSLLVAVRNALLHFKSKEYFSKVDGKPAVFNQVALVDKLRSKNIPHEIPPDAQGHLNISVGSTALATTEFVSQGRIIGSENVPYKLSPDAPRASWTLLISTKAVAEWACNTAAEMALDFIGNAPRSGWKSHMEQYFSKAFSDQLK